MQRSKNIRPKSPRQLEREIAEALAKPRSAHAARKTVGARLSWEGERIPIDPSPRTIKPFELSRPYVVRHGGRLFTVVRDTQRGHVAHPAEVEGRTQRDNTRKGKAGASKRVSHATKAAAGRDTTKAAAGRDKTSDKINIDQLAKLFDLPDWERVDEMNQHNYWEMSRGAGDEEEQQEAEQKAQEEIYRQWYDAVESAANKLFEEHGLELDPTGKQGTKDRRYDFKIVPGKSWDDAADKLRETINGVGTLHFDTLRDFLDSGPYTARQAVLSHLGYIKRYPAVYGGQGANQMYAQAWR